MGVNWDQGGRQGHRYVQCRPTSLGTSVILYHRRFEYTHATVDLSFYLSEIEFPEADLTPTPPFRWVDLRELCGLRFPDANQEVVSLLWDRDQKRSEAQGWA